MSEHWTDRLSEYVDGELPAGDLAALEAHLEACASCAATVEDLRAVVQAARSLPEELPPGDLWPSIESRLAPRTGAGVVPGVLPIGRPPRAAGRRVVMTLPQLVAAGIALVIFSAGGMWMASQPRSQGLEAPVVAAEGPQGGAVSFASSWEVAVAELEAEFDRRRSELDPSTILVVERNLAIIDEAIAEARRALEADPASGFLNSYVADAMRRKVDLLRQATRIQRAES